MKTHITKSDLTLHATDPSTSSRQAVWDSARFTDIFLASGLYSQAAELSLAGIGVLGELRSLYLQDMRLRVPPVVKSWYVEDEEKYRLEEIVGRDLSLVKNL